MKPFKKIIKGIEKVVLVWSTVMLLMLTAPIGYAQSPVNLEHKFSRFSLNFAYGNQTIGFPFQKLFTAFNPTIGIDASYQLNKSKTHAVLVGISTSLNVNKVIGYTFSSGANITYQYTHKSGLFANLGLNFGDNLQVLPRRGFVYDVDKQTFEPAQRAKVDFYAGIAIALGYDFSPQHNKGYALFVRNKSFIQFSYFNTAGLPILPYNIIELGLQVKFRTK